MSDLIYKDESYAIIGACFNVNKTMGCGFLESQVINYLNATKFKLGIFVNFGHHPKLEYKRLVF